MKDEEPEMKIEKFSKKTTNKSEETEILEALVWILELDDVEMKIIVDTAQELGILSFFASFDNLELNSDTKEKIRALQNILETFDGNVDDLDFYNEGSEGIE